VVETVGSTSDDPDSSISPSSLGVWTARAIAAFVGIVFYFLLPASIDKTTRIVAAWDLAVLVLVAEGAFIILRSTPESARLRAVAEDPGRIAILAVSIGASLASLAASILIMRNESGDTIAGIDVRAILAVAAIFGAWTLLHIAFTLHYARLYYTANDPEPILDFRGGPPDDADFAYFSFGIGMTFQVADVEITTSELRRLCLAHQLLAFLYNTAILALVINLIAGNLS
jgi:uncharacterized membrane protein